MDPALSATEDTTPAATVVIYHIDDEETPYRSKLKKQIEEITLADFKQLVLNLTKQFKFFFKSEDADFGVVKEEINDDKALLPAVNGRIEAWLVSVDSSAHSDTTPSSHGAARLNKQVVHPSPASRAPLAPSTHRQCILPRERFADDSACTSETESTIAGLPQGKFDHRLNRRSYRQQAQMLSRGLRPTSHPRNMQQVDCGGESIVNSELENTSYYESDDDRASFSTDITSVSRQNIKKRRKKRTMPVRPLTSKISEISSVTESNISAFIFPVVLNIEVGGFLGIRIYGRSNYPNGDGGIFVSSVVKGGAVALDGRIQPGDKILQVNDIPFDDISNDGAVQVLREAVQNPGPVKLVIAKGFDPNHREYLDFRQCEPVRPIDPGAWVAHTNALLPPIEQQQRCTSAATGSSANSGSFHEHVTQDERDGKLDINVDSVQKIVKAMARPNSGLEVKTRNWLKIKIPDAFLGSDLVDWLLMHVQGFTDRKEARKFASRLLKENYIKHTVNKFTFTDQCYYVFNNLCDEFSDMRVCGGSSHDEYGCGGVHSDQDTLPVLPPPPPSVSQHPMGLGGVVASPPFDPPTYSSFIYAGAGTATNQQQQSTAPMGGGSRLMNTSDHSAASSSADVIGPAPSSRQPMGVLAPPTGAPGYHHPSSPCVVLATTGGKSEIASSSVSGGSANSSGSERRATARRGILPSPLAKQ